MSRSVGEINRTIGKTMEERNDPIKLNKSCKNKNLFAHEKNETKILPQQQVNSQTEQLCNDYSNNSIFNQVLSRVATELDSSCQTANQFIVGVDSFIMTIQQKISTIISYNTLISHKKSLITRTMNNFFTRDSIWQIPSFTDKITELSTKNYLYQLSKLSTRYPNIELRFDKNYFKLYSKRFRF
jgi:uncharacterized membrane protein YheB (UPF0754 family)